MNLLNIRSQLLLFISLLVIIPLGISTKFYTGIAEEWVKDYCGDILYEICWCLFIFSLIPKHKQKQAIVWIPVWVFLVTCGLEFLQLWQTPILQIARSSFIGKLILGTTFVWWDFPYYLLGSWLGWLWLKQIYRLSL
ncbi:MAG: DUF2809 domain-containing protein [Xenococcaceae cyanobacterium]